MPLTRKQWNELKEGYGLEEVPSELLVEMVCQMCARKWPGKLYTDRPIGSYSTLREYQEMVDRMRQNCFCRYHAELMFGEQQ